MRPAHIHMAWRATCDSFDGVWHGHDIGGKLEAGQVLHVLVIRVDNFGQLPPIDHLLSRVAAKFGAQCYNLIIALSCDCNRVCDAMTNDPTLRRLCNKCLVVARVAIWQSSHHHYCNRKRLPREQAQRQMHNVQAVKCVRCERRCAQLLVRKTSSEFQVDCHV